MFKKIIYVFTYQPYVQGLHHHLHQHNYMHHCLHQAIKF
jgi:hypothetical protein